MSKTRKSNKAIKWPSRKEIRDKMIKDCPQLAAIPPSAFNFYTKDEWAAMETIFRLKVEQPNKFQRIIDIVKAKHSSEIK